MTKEDTLLFTWRKIYWFSERWEKDVLGKYTYTDGRVSIGNYKNGKKNGNIKIKCPNGDTYQSDFKNGSPSENSFLPIQKERFLKLISRDSKILV